ncbi:hypothetical protein ACH4LQ_11740 [Streptomyces globisporus]|uniref:hypothetical protein n=1 Tax=Streptomyces globisporus TaxID=1908 RepID=UPI00378E985B
MTNSGASNNFDLSDDARREAEEFITAFREELLLRSKLYAESRGSAVVQRRDVHLAGQDLDIFGKRRSEENPKRLLFIIGGAGVCVSVILGVVLVAGGLEQADKLASVMGAIVGFLGLAISVAAVIRANRPVTVGETRKGGLGGDARSHVIGNADAGELIAVWRDIEDLMRADLSDDVAMRRKGMGVMMREYSQRNDLGFEFISSIRGLLDVRNRLIHGGTPVNQAEAEDSLAEAQRIIRMMRARHSNGPGDSPSDA